MFTGLFCHFLVFSKTIIFALIFLIPFSMRAQDTVFFEYYNAYWNYTSPDFDAKYKSKITKTGDDYFIESYNLENGKIHSKGHFKSFNANSKVKHGYFYYYDNNGNLTHKGMYNKSEMFGKWHVFNKIKLSFEVIDYTDAYRALKEDSIEKFANFQDHTSIPVFGNIENSSEETVYAFYYYIYSNLSYPIDALNNKEDGLTYSDFTINPEGQISQIYVYGNTSFSLKLETARLILDSPKWIPAKKNKKNIHFRIEGFPIKFELPE